MVGLSALFACCGILATTNPAASVSYAHIGNGTPTNHHVANTAASGTHTPIINDTLTAHHVANTAASDARAHIGNGTPTNHHVANTAASVTHTHTINDTLMGHHVVVDDTQKLVSWATGPDPFMDLFTLAWDFWTNGSIPADPHTGHPLYFFYAAYHPDTKTGREWPSTPASMVNYLAQAALAVFAYSGDITPTTKFAMPLGRYLMANGTTPQGWVWPSMPYASSDPGAYTYKGANSSRFGGLGRGDGYHIIEPDKAAEAAYGYLLIADAIQDKEFFAAAVAVADTLAAQVRAPPISNAHTSPWPFRVNATTGVVEEQYTSNVIMQVLVLDHLLGRDNNQKLRFDQEALISLASTDEQVLGPPIRLLRAAAYERAREIALKWQRTFPEVNGRWTACCEDVPIDTSLTNYNSMQPLWAAQYLISRREPKWQERAWNIVRFVEKNLIFTDSLPGTHSRAIQWGARCVSEQRYYMLKMGIHTGRYAVTVSMLEEAEGGNDPTLRDIAYRSFAWASYCTQPDGANLVGPNEKDVWFRIQLGGGVLQMIHAMSYASQARPSTDHLLLSFPIGQGSVPVTISYLPENVTWLSSRLPSTDRLRISFIPVMVISGGMQLSRRQQATVPHSSEWWSYDSKTGVVVVAHSEAAGVSVVG